MDKKTARLRRACRTRERIRAVGAFRLSVHKTPRHIYATVNDHNGAKVLASASSLDKDFKQSLSYGGNVKAAQMVGKMVASRAVAKGITRVAFDRSGFKYHGRIAALAQAARENGLSF